jgi:hypothetical protein
MKISQAITTQSVVKKQKKQKKPTGFILYEGKSNLDPSQDIVAIVTTKSSNRKVGDMMQLWILNKDINPLTASKEKRDNAVCGDCKLKQSAGGACYVVLFQAPFQVWKSYKKGSYKHLELNQYHKYFTDAKIRFGAYGDPAALPIEILASLKAYAANNTSYTHQWKDKASQGLKTMSMASVDNEHEAKEATKMGWRYFRVAKTNEELLENEIICPNVTHNVSCINCNLCNGSKENENRKNIVIPVHGVRANRF